MEKWRWRNTVTEVEEVGVKDERGMKWRNGDGGTQ